MFVGVTTDQAGDFMLLKRSITIAWFTYGRDGRPFWLYGNVQFSPGVREATVPMTYAANGGFAGAATGNALALGDAGGFLPGLRDDALQLCGERESARPGPDGIGPAIVVAADGGERAGLHLTIRGLTPIRELGSDPDWIPGHRRNRRRPG
jgi:hypothetical protein